ncbi:MAG: lipid-A-disaccharide synthase [Gammaproteobacteria bacterium]|nr:lipid-A-disaccharide synthase [Gammaproteobacteria bacterium]
MKYIGLVAAEPSGDQLGSHLMAAIKKLDPEVHFEGVGGKKMTAEGLKSLVPMEKLSVMGIVEVLKHLPGLLKIRKNLVKRWSEFPPDIFIGIDAPDFNLGLENTLHKLGVPTVHYVCPSIWAWREGRVKTLRKAVDLVISLFPFEVPLLNKHQVNALFGGHPLGHELKDIPDKNIIREQLGIPADRPTLALLPGSRLFEVEQLTHDFLDTAKRVAQKNDQLVVLVPLVTPRIQDYFMSQLSTEHKILDIRFFDGQSREVLAAADVVLLASGTATLEAMLYKKPMVVAYKVHWLTHFITFKLGLVKTPYIALPNILAGREIVPELFQEKCQPDILAKHVLTWFTNRTKRHDIIETFSKMKLELEQNNIDEAAKAVLDLVKK